MRLLIIGNLNSDIKVAVDIAKANEAKVTIVGTIEQALDFLRSGKGTDLILVEVCCDIATLSASMRQEHISTPIVAYGVQCSPKEAVTAIKSGAREFLPLPPDEQLIAEIFSTIASDLRPMIGDSSALKQVLIIADKIAKSDANVLVTGKSGTGKEVLAQYIHHNSARSKKPFVRVNCAAIPENLLESELFGHEKGAFTGAIARRIGRFEESSGGTLLLDEISEMDIRLQAKLLRAIQEQEIDRVGGAKPIKVDLRIIATSNRDLLREIAKGTFREDLYFRLNIINIELPPLSERKEDILVLSDYFVNKYCKNNNLAKKTISKKAMKKLQNYSWPGNIRELENIIHRAVLLAESDVIEDNDIYIKEINIDANNGITLRTSEHDLLKNTVGYCLGDLNQAATILGISIKSLKDKLDFYTEYPCDNKVVEEV